MVERQNINIPLIVTIGLISSVLLFVIAVGLQAWFYNEVEDERAIKHEGHVNWNLANQNLAQEERLQTYRIIDASKQTVAIPIDEAIRLTARRLAPPQPE